MLQLHSSRHSALWRIGAGFVVAAGLFAATLARADYLWLQPEGNQAKVYAGELHKPVEKLTMRIVMRCVEPDLLFGQFFDDIHELIGHDCDSDNSERTDGSSWPERRRRAQAIAECRQLQDDAQLLTASAEICA